MAGILFGRSPRRTLARIALLVGACVLLFGFVLLPVRLRGISMEPTYGDDELNFANRAAYWMRRPRRGDVVAIRLAGLNAFYVKRIVGLPGETVEIQAGLLLIDGRPLFEPYVEGRAPWNLAALVVGPHEYFVVGDNRAMALKDHEFGLANRQRIVGRLLY